MKLFPKIRRKSIYFSISVIFGISIVLLIASAVVLVQNDHKNHIGLLNKKADMLARLVRKQSSVNMNEVQFGKILEDMDVEICPEYKMLLDPRLKLLSIRKSRRIVSKVFIYDSEHYFLVQTLRFGVLFKDTIELNDNKNIIIAVFGFVLFLFLFLFFTIIKKLSKIKELKLKIQQLGTKDLKYTNIYNNSEEKDEIEELLYEFYLSAKRLQDIKDARNVFIRNIMHELKTPIMKGNLVTEFISDDENKHKLKNIFSRLDELINEFASIERVISNSNNIVFKKYMLTDIVDNAIDLLLLDDDLVDVDISDVELEVDFNLFSIAIKNLLDNGLKYSTNNSVRISTKNNNIEISNIGSKLKFDLNEYFEPFFKGENEYKTDSFGLGLYLVKNILDVHKFELSYRYENEQNIFCIKKR